jgi:2-dehydro-3-deoxyphosphogalactonate aldolase
VGCTGFGLGTYLFKPGMSVAEVAERAKLAVTAYDKGEAK